MAKKNTPLILNITWFSLSLVKEFMNMKKLSVALGILVAAVMAGNAATEATGPVVGYSKYTLGPGQYLFSPTFVKAFVLKGNGTISGQSLSVSGVNTSSLTPTAFNDGVTPNYPRAYVEILSGDYAGVAFDITSATTSSVIASDFPSALNGLNVSFAIRPHVTLDDIFKAETGFPEYSDSIKLFNSDGSESIRFLSGGIITTDDFVTPAGHTPIYTGGGVLLNLTASVTLTLTGEVKSTITKVPVFPGVNNIVGSLDPSSGLKVTSSNLATSLTAYSDSATLYSNDGSFTLQNFIYSDGASVTDDTFTAYDPANAPIIPSGYGILVNLPNPQYVVLNSAIR
jgi:hypothetical protein